MERQNIKPNVWAYNAMISSACVHSRGGGIEMATENGRGFMQARSSVLLAIASFVLQEELDEGAELSVKPHV
ncbi:hypothetical protein SLA2020_500930 [Shorea laevis]